MLNLKWKEFIFIFPFWKGTYFLALSLKRLRNGTNPVVKSTPSTQIPLPSENTQGFLKKWLIPDWRQEEFRINVSIFIMPESNKGVISVVMLKKNPKNSLSKGIPTGQRWEILSTKKHNDYNWLKLLNI